MNAGELVGRDLLEPHHRSGLVERPLRCEHPFHQARFGSGEHVADLALVLHRGAQRVLDRAAVEAGDRLELVERDDDLLLALGGQPGGQREHLLRQLRDVTVGPTRRGTTPRRRRCPASSGSGPERSGLPRAPTGPHRAATSAPGPSAFRPRPAPGRSPSRNADVGTEAADRDVDGERAALLHRGHRAPDQRRLAVAAGGDQEDFLGRREIADQPVELERRGSRRPPPARPRRRRTGSALRHSDVMVTQVQA